MEDEYNKELLREIEEHNGRELEKSCASLHDMLERVEYYALTGNMEQSKRWLVTAREHIKTKQDRRDVLMMMAKYEQDHTTASLCYEEAASLVDPKHESEIGQLLFKSGVEAFYAKNYERAITLVQKAIELIANNPEFKSDYYIGLNTLGNCFFATEEYEKAISILTSLSERYREDEDYEGFHDTRCHIATNLKYLKRYDEALDLLRQALSFYDSKGLHLNYLSGKAELESCLAHAGHELSKDSLFHDKSEAQSKRILDNELVNLEGTRNYLGEDQYARSLGVICGTYLLLGDTHDCLTYARMYIDVLREVVARRFSYSSFSDRALFWNSHKDNIRQIKGLVNRQSIVQGETAALLYDIALLEKGILLKSSIEIRRILHEKGDPTLDNLYSQACGYENLRRSRPLTPGESLEYEKVNMALMAGCAEFRDYTVYLRCGWQEIRKALGNDDIAIEFILVQDNPPFPDKTFIAVVLSNDEDYPAAIPLCSEDSVSMLAKESDNAEEGAMTPPVMFWEKLQPWLVRKKRVYFSPDGPLCYYGIEYMKGADGAVADHFEVHRISSTRELLSREEAPCPLSSATLFGGASYRNDGYSRLYYSMDEVIDIRTLMLEAGVPHVELVTRSRVTKAAILSLSEKAPSCIHLAVHGEYEVSAGDDTDGMEHSFLVLSNGETITAKEIADMDLHGCELVVLSSCYGSLGKMMDDGIFGLQRAFKNAGVKAILMSTGTIDDRVSSILMKAFYKSLLSGQSLHDAYESAQGSAQESLPTFRMNATLQRFVLLEN